MKSHYFVIWSLYQSIRMPETSKSCEKMRDFTQKYFHLNSSAVYNSSAKNTVVSEFRKKDHTNCSVTILYPCGELNEWPPRWTYRLTNERKEKRLPCRFVIRAFKGTLYRYLHVGFYNKCLVYGDFRKVKHTILSPKCIIHVLIQFPLNCSVNFLLWEAGIFELKTSKSWWCDTFTEWKLNKVIIWESIMWHMLVRLLVSTMKKKKEKRRFIRGFICFYFRYFWIISETLDYFYLWKS